VALNCIGGISIAWVGDLSHSHSHSLRSIMGGGGSSTTEQASSLFSHVGERVFLPRCSSYLAFSVLVGDLRGSLASIDIKGSSTARTGPSLVAFSCVGGRSFFSLASHPVKAFNALMGDLVRTVRFMIGGERRVVTIVHCIGVLVWRLMTARFRCKVTGFWSQTHLLSFFFFLLVHSFLNTYS
jgi:hypothetical protein